MDMAVPYPAAGGGSVPNALAPLPVPTGSGSHFQIDDSARTVMVKTIMKTLEKHLPVKEGLSRLENIAKKFELKFFTTARSKSSYAQKIAMLLFYVEAPSKNPQHQAPGFPPQGNNPAESSAASVMSQQQTRETNTSRSSGNEDEGNLNEAYDMLSPLPSSSKMNQYAPCDEFFNWPFSGDWEDLGRFPHSSTNIQSATDDEVYDWSCSNTLDDTEDLSYASMADGKTSLKKRKLDGPSSSAPVPSSTAYPEFRGLWLHQPGEPAAAPRADGIDD